MPDAWVERWAASVPQERATDELFTGIAEAEPAACELPGRLRRARSCSHSTSIASLWTREGFEDAVAALPDARVVRCKEIPVFDAAFGEALRELAAE